MKLFYLGLMVILLNGMWVVHCESKSGLSETMIQPARYKSRVLRISVFYDDTYDHMEDIIKYSVDIVNRQIQPVDHFEFEITLNKVDNSNSFRLSRILCGEISQGRIAVVAIGNSPTFQILQLISTNLNIPYLTVRNLFDEEAKVHRDEASTNTNTDTNYVPHKVISMYPPGHKLVQSLTDLIKHYKWKYVTVLYQESYGFERIQNLIKTTNMNQDDPHTFKVRVRQLSKDISQWVYVIKDIKSSGTSHIVVDIEPQLLNEFINQATEVGVMTAYFHFLFTALDLSIITYAPPANVTAFQIFEPNSSRANNLVTEFNFKNMVKNRPLFKYLPSYAAFVYDTFSLIAYTVQKMKLVDKIMMITPTGSCESERPWSHGVDFNQYLKLSKFEGVSGNVEFDPQTGFRTNLTMSIVDLGKDDLVDLIGYWNDEPRDGTTNVKIIRSFAKEHDKLFNRLNRRLNVTTKLEAPYVMLATPEGNETLYGNAMYKGFCVDLLERISKICQFNYTIKLVEDGLHGTQVNGKWNGIVRELIDKKSDLSVAALTISYQREQVIDFTKPFLNLGISILYKRPAKKKPNLFSFLAPLSFEIWIYILLAYLGISFMLFVLARFSPYEWRRHNKCSKESEEIEIVRNDFTLFNSLWFTVGSLMQQGIDFNPKSLSTRILTGAWWFFALIMISSYTANLAAFLTTKRLTSPVEDAEGLSKQSEIRYGCLNGGSTQQFFQESKIQTYERMWNFMSNNPNNFVQSYEEGIARVKKGGYAYLVESITNEYARAIDCELMQIGGLLDTKGYGIGTPAGSPWREKISNAILQLQENGELQELYSKWWIKENLNRCERQEKSLSKTESASELSLASVGGVFAVLALGMCLAFIVAILEFFWISTKPQTYANDPLSMKERMIRDWKFAACNTKARLHHSSKRRSLSISSRGRDYEETLKQLREANRMLNEERPAETDSDKVVLAPRKKNVEFPNSLNGSGSYERGHKTLSYNFTSRSSELINDTGSFDEIYNYDTQNGSGSNQKRVRMKKLRRNRTNGTSQNGNGISNTNTFDLNVGRQFYEI